MLYLNDVKVTPTIFPDKTSQIWNLPKEILGKKEYSILWDFENEGEIMHLAQLVELIGNYEVPKLSVNLTLKYLPYGRQDKAVSNDTTFALHSFARLINSMNFDWVNIVDPHSKEAIRLIDRSRAEYPFNLLLKVLESTGSNVLCFPDAGAVEKYTLLYNGRPYIYGEKVRDQFSGKILKYSLHGNPEHDKVLIVDDICDGGATFLLLAKELYRNGAKEVNLFVTHGIFSKGLRPLLDAGIKRIFTQDGEASEEQIVGSGTTKLYPTIINTGKITYRRL